MDWGRTGGGGKKRGSKAITRFSVGYGELYPSIIRFERLDSGLFSLCLAEIVGLSALC